MNLAEAGDRSPIASGRIQSVSRAARLLMLVAGGRAEPTGKGLARAAGLPVPTAHHLLSTLVDEGLLAKDSKARYQLGMKVAVLADALQRAVTAPEYLLEPLRQLALTTGETAYLATWRQGDIRIQASFEGTHPVRVSLPVGPYTDAHARATGKLLLAMAGQELRSAYLLAHPPRAITPRTVVDLERLEEEFEAIRLNGHALDEEQFRAGRLLRRGAGHRRGNCGRCLFDLGADSAVQREAALADRCRGHDREIPQVASSADFQDRASCDHGDAGLVGKVVELREKRGDR